MIVTPRWVVECDRKGCDAEVVFIFPGLFESAFDLKDILRIIRDELERDGWHVERRTRMAFCPQHSG